MLLNLADLPANRAIRLHGNAEPAGEGDAMFPQLQSEALTARASRAMSGRKRRHLWGQEQTMLPAAGARASELSPSRGLSTNSRQERSARSSSRAAPSARGAHTTAIRSAQAARDEPQDLRRGVVEHCASSKKQERLLVGDLGEHAVLPRGDGTEEVSETCTVITTLLDHQAAPADAVRETYLTRWSASETTFGEDKMTITGAGNRTSGPVLRSGSPRLVISEACGQPDRNRSGGSVGAAAEHRRERVALRREDSAPVTADEESCTAVWVTRAGRRHVVGHVHHRWKRSPRGRCRRPRRPAHLNVPGRQRHSKRAQKASPKFPHATATKTTITGKPQVTVFAPGFC